MRYRLTVSFIRIRLAETNTNANLTLKQSMDLEYSVSNRDLAVTKINPRDPYLLKLSISPLSPAKSMFRLPVYTATCSVIDAENMGLQ